MSTGRRGFLISLLAGGAAVTTSTPVEATPPDVDDVIDGGTP